MQPAIKSFHLLDEWVALTERWCRAKAERIELTGEHGGVIRAVVYRQGRQLFQPSPSPYLGFEFEPTPTDQLHRVTRQWHEVAERFLTDLRRLGWSKWVCLPPAVTDARPFTWGGALVTPRYTYTMPLREVANEQLRAPDVRRRCKKAAQDGYIVEKNEDLDAVMHSLKSTEAKQNFDHALSRPDLEAAVQLLGPDRFRIYNAYDAQHRPASTMVILHRPGAPLQEWVAGTATEHLKSGVSQLVFAQMFADVQCLDAPSFDFCGANFPSVAAAKLQLGGTLTPYYMLEPLTARYLIRTANRCLLSRARPHP